MEIVAALVLSLAVLLGLMAHSMALSNDLRRSSFVELTLSGTGERVVVNTAYIWQVRVIPEMPGCHINVGNRTLDVKESYSEVSSHLTNKRMPNGNQ